LTKVTIIIHEGSAGPRGRGRRQRPFGGEEGHGERQFSREGGHGPRHGCHSRHGERQFSREGERVEGRPAFGERPPLSEAERHAARHVRHEVRRIMRAAEEAGLSPERVARLIRRQTRHDFN